MAEVVLIDENWIKEYTYLTSAVDPELIEVASKVAQDKYITIRTGDALMRKLKTEAAAGTLSGYYQTLVEDYLRITLTWYTVYELMPRLYVRWDNGAPQIRISDETTVISQGDLQREMQNALENAQSYEQRMVDWLCVNGHQMPEYSESTAPDRAARGGNVYNFSGITVGGRKGTPKYPNWAYDE